MKKMAIPTYEIQVDCCDYCGEQTKHTWYYHEDGNPMGDAKELCKECWLKVCPKGKCEKCGEEMPIAYMDDVQCSTDDGERVTRMMCGECKDKMQRCKKCDRKADTPIILSIPTNNHLVLCPYCAAQALEKEMKELAEQQAICEVFAREIPKQLQAMGYKHEVKDFIEIVWG